MIAAEAGVDRGRAAELGHEHDDDLVEQAAVLEVVDERGERAVDLRDEPLGHVEIVAVRVPVIRGRLHKLHAGLDQAARLQEMPAERMRAVTFDFLGVEAVVVEEILPRHELDRHVVGGL